VSETASTARRGRLLRIAVACAVLLALAGYVAVRLTTGAGPGAPRCTVSAPGQDGPAYEMDPEQAVNAATIEAVGSSLGVPERAVTIALATAMQESALRNIRYGDRDSLGLFQQRPSQGWGSTEQIMDPVFAAGSFYEHLEKVPGYSRLPLTVAAQRVQRSGYPQAYAKHEPEAALLAAALTGRTGGVFSCVLRPGGDDDPGDPAQVRARLVREFGPDVLPPGGTADGSGPQDGSGTVARGGNSRSPAGSVLEVPVRPAAGRDGSGRRGWEVAHWAVAHASELRIDQVVYAGRVWSAGESAQGWRTVGEGSRASVRPGSDAVLITTAR
jgi:hypothetical protein